MPHADAQPGFRAAVTPERILAILLVAEILLFAAVGRNFASLENGLAILRLSVEIGLLAVALTPVIVAGGIDLSVGALMGLCAVLFGKMTQAAGLPAGVAAAATVAAGAAAGGLNAALVARLGLPPLIVTLATLSLFRGLAEGLTGGSESFACPEGFLFLGRGIQVPLFLGLAAAAWVALHRTPFGRALFAIGHSPEGARHAGIPVGRRLAAVYIASGAAAALASLVYVARFTQARADAGFGHELLAITAVVLGGTSIFGGRGTLHGTLLGLFAITILERGMMMAGASSLLGKVLVGVLLLVALGAERLAARPGRAS